MIKVNEAVEKDGVVEPKHEVQVVCANCGYDLDDSEVAADTCSDCGETLSLQQSMKIYATTTPAAGGSTLA